MRLLRFLFYFLFNLIAFGIIAYFFWPIASWYFNHRPILGVDFFNSATFARMFSNNFDPLPLKFMYFTYAGSPVSANIIFLWYQVMGWVAKIIPLISAIKYTMLISFGFLLIFTYLAAYRLSKNQTFSALIAVLIAYSSNMYGSLIWGGSLPYFANQLFFPAVLWSATVYIQENNRRFYWLTILFIGLAMLGHLFNSGAFILPGAVAVLVFGQRGKPVSWKKKFTDALVLMIVPYFFAFRLAANTYTAVFTQILRMIFSKIPSLQHLSAIEPGQPVAVSQISEDILAVDRSRFLYLYSDTARNLFSWLGIGLVIFIITFIIIGKRKRFLGHILPWILLCFYSVLHVFLNSRGIPFLFQGWYREFWHFPITLGLLSAALVGYSHLTFYSVSKWAGRIFYGVIFIVSIVFFGSVYITSEYTKTISLLEYQSSTSSAYPEAINLVENQRELDNLKKSLVPDWLNPQDRNYRIYTSDAQVNVWWNSLFDMPLVRGYLDSVIGSGLAGDHFLLDQAIGGDGLVANFKYQPEIARNMALYYLDWFAVKYVEGGHLSQSANKRISSYLEDIVAKNTQTKTQGAYIMTDAATHTRKIISDLSQELNYYQFADNFVSPVISVTNSPAVLCLCDWSTYQSLTKILSMHNINSAYLISVNSDKNIDSFSAADLAKFSAVILSNYHYHNKKQAFSELTKYVERGGNLIIDTGGNAPEAKSNELPELFPFTKSIRTGLGKMWDLHPSDDSIYKDISLSEFSPPVYEEQEWNFSYPVGDVKKDADILLTQKDKPVLIRSKKGSGIIYWSGMNLTYHVQHYANITEGNFFMNLLRTTVPLELHKYIAGQAEFKGDRKVIFESAGGGRGLLFKQEYFQGWRVKLKGQQADCYAAGPTYPGFIYVPLTGSGKVEAQFIYTGNPYAWLVWTGSLIIFILLIDQIIFAGGAVTKHLVGLWFNLRRITSSWWEKEDA